MRHSHRNQCGHAVIEAALLMPWVFFLFAGALDFGFYGYALINTQNAARVAAMQTSATWTTAGNSTLACTYVLNEMQSVSNLQSVTSCDALPIKVTATAVSGASSADGAKATQVSVTYQSPQLIPFPGVTGKMTVTRTAQIRVRG